MGGNRTPKAPKPFVQEYPGDQVRDIIDDAGSGVRKSTGILEDKAQGYRDV